MALLIGKDRLRIESQLASQGHPISRLSLSLARARPLHAAAAPCWSPQRPSTGDPQGLALHPHTPTTFAVTVGSLFLSHS